MTTERLPLVIIGSGFGGATVAARLAEAGIPATLLERGPWRDTTAIRNAGICGAAPLPRGRHFISHGLRRLAAPLLPGGQLDLHRDGVFDLHYQQDLSILCASGVGGGSHVYSAMNVPPEQGWWDGHHPDINSDMLEPHYRWIMQRLGSEPPATAGHPVPNAVAQDNFRPKWMLTDHVPQPPMGFRYEQQTYANNSYFGSVDNSKITLDACLLLPSLNHGLQIKDRHEVLDISALQPGFRLTVMDHGAGKLRTLLADHVILTAGMLNTLRLLLASRARGGLRGMPALGLGLGGNGDVAAWWASNEAGRDYSTGTPCHGRFALEGYGEQAILTRFGFNGIDDLPLPRLLRERLKRDLILVAMGKDQANGLARWRNGRLQLAYNQAANPVLEHIAQAFTQIARLSNKPVRFPRHHPMTVHPYGGARLGDNLSSSVLNANGEVHDVPGLFIADASALPAAPGVPPSMTIAAWAGHVATQFLASQGSQNWTPLIGQSLDGDKCFPPS